MGWICGCCTLEKKCVWATDLSHLYFILLVLVVLNVRTVVQLRTCRRVEKCDVFVLYRNKGIGYHQLLC